MFIFTNKIVRGGLQAPLFTYLLVVNEQHMNHELYPINTYQHYPSIEYLYKSCCPYITQILYVSQPDYGALILKL